MTVRQPVMAVYCNQYLDKLLQIFSCLTYPAGKRCRTAGLFSYNMDVLIVFLMTLAMFVGFMLVIRKPLLWYYRINEQVENQRQIIGLLKSIDSKMSNSGHAHQPKDGRPDNNNTK